jgi:hypothetical protein
LAAEKDDTGHENGGDHRIRTKREDNRSRPERKRRDERHNGPGSKNPKFVKDLRTKIDFQTLAEGRLFIKNSWMKVDAGMVIKHIRMAVEEEYSDIEIL